MFARTLMLACLASWLAACGATKPALVKTEVVEVEKPVQKALDPRLTTVAPEPKNPPLSCRDKNGKKTVCGKDFTDNFDAWRAYARSLAGQLREIAGLQPKP